MRKKAEMGIGTLIIFIAMILVAAIAAGVLIQTAGSLQNKALLTGKRSKTQVSTSLRPVIIYAEDGSDGNVEEFYAKFKLAPGSDPLKVEDLLISLDLKNDSADMKYNSSAGSCAGLSSTDDGYYMTYLITGENWRTGYLQRGDVVEFCFQSTRTISEDEEVTLSFIPKVGSPTTIDTALPDIMSKQRIVVYP